MRMGVKWSGVGRLLSENMKVEGAGDEWVWGGEMWEYREEERPVSSTLGPSKYLTGGFIRPELPLINHRNKAWLLQQPPVSNN